MSEMMDCTKYHARIPVSTCLLRHRKAVAAGTSGRWGSAGAAVDIGCMKCEQGAAVAAGDITSVTVTKKISAEMRAACECESVRLKTCKKCGNTLPVDQFPFNAGNKDNRYSACNTCCAQWRAAYRHRMKAGKAAADQRPAEPTEDGPQEIPPSELIQIQRPNRDTIVLVIGVATLEHIDIVVRPRKQPKPDKEVQP